MTPKLSIIIVNYRSADALEHCLRSIHVATITTPEIIIVDNSGADGAKQVLKASGFKGHYFLQADNIGYTRAANIGARHATGQYFCFLNPDMILEAGSLDHLMDWLDQHPRTVAGPRERDAEGKIATTAFPRMTRRAIWGLNFFYKRQWPWKWHPLLPGLVPSFSYAYACRTATAPLMAPVLSGSCLMMSRVVWSEVGEWNESLTYFGLESEWFRRAEEIGVVAWYIPSAEVFHEHALSIRRAEGWKVREIADENRKWHARKIGLITLGVLILVLWLEHKLRPRRGVA